MENETGHRNDAFNRSDELGDLPVGTRSFQGARKRPDRYDENELVMHIFPRRENTYKQ